MNAPLETACDEYEIKFWTPQVTLKRFVTENFVILGKRFEENPFFSILRSSNDVIGNRTRHRRLKMLSTIIVTGDEASHQKYVCVK